MSKTLVIGNEEFEFPEEGENSGYGESVTDWAEAVTDALSSVQKPNDITDTSATILNNISSPTAIPGFSFDTSEVIAITGEYIVTRSTDVPAVTLVEDGEIRGNFNGTSWTISHKCRGASGVSFDITSGGQITYTSTNMTGSAYAGEIIFKAKVFNQV